MIAHESELNARPVYGDGIQDVSKQILVGPRDGFNGYLREFTLGPGGHTPYHDHGWYHVVYILAGSGTVRYENQEQEIRSGSVIYVEADKSHNFANTGDTEMRFLCMVPENGDAYAEGD
jgi:quercetin dioxygenase-like cupin family protein